MRTLFLGFLGIGQRAGNALVGIVHVLIEDFALLGLQAILLVPDIEGYGLYRYFLTLFIDHLDGFQHERSLSF